MSLSVRSTAAAVLGALSLTLAACGGAPASDAGAAEAEPLSLVDSTEQGADSDQPDNSSSDGSGDEVAVSPDQSDSSAGAPRDLTSSAQLAGVCEGVTFSNLAPIVGEPRKIAFVENYTSGDRSFAVASDVSLNDVQFDFVADDLLNLDYVGCIVEVSRDRSDLGCAIVEADGASVAFDVYELNLAVKVIDAASGEEVAVEPVAASLESCPTELPAVEDSFAPIDAVGLRLAMESHLVR